MVDVADGRKGIVMETTEREPERLTVDDLVEALYGSAPDGTGVVLWLRDATGRMADGLDAIRAHVCGPDTELSHQGKQGVAWVVLDAQARLSLLPRVIDHYSRQATDAPAT